jgi:hypothetical protein
LPNTVLSWKKAQKLGRFDPNALFPETMLKMQAEKDETEIKQRGKWEKKERHTFSFNIILISNTQSSQSSYGTEQCYSPPILFENQLKIWHPSFFLATSISLSKPSLPRQGSNCPVV